MTRVIGLTGGIGSGKSTVSRYLSELGAAIIDADKLGHEVYLPNTESWRDLVKTFGKEILTPADKIDRKKLATIVFNNPEKLQQLNAIVHPRMFEIAKQRIEDNRRQGTKVVILDAPILFEANWTPLVEAVWVVVANEANVVKRAVARSGLTEEQVRLRIRSQMSNKDRIQRAQVVIHNDGTAEDLRNKVNELWYRLKI
jgi:dephospho-CoA kinase